MESVYYFGLGAAGAASLAALAGALWWRPTVPWPRLPRTWEARPDSSPAGEADGATGDWSMHDVLHYLESAAGLRQEAALEALRQAAVTPAITAWGRREVRREPSDLERPLRHIGRDYWLEARFDPETCLGHSNPHRASTALYNPDEWVATGTFVDLRFASAEIKRRWPGARSEERNRAG